MDINFADIFRQKKAVKSKFEMNEATTDKNMYIVDTHTATAAQY